MSHEQEASRYRLARTVALVTAYRQGEDFLAQFMEVREQGLPNQIDWLRDRGVDVNEVEGLLRD